MKKLALLITGLLIGLTTVSAVEKSQKTLSLAQSVTGEDLSNNRNNHFTQPIQFIERGIQFLIFPDGSFDFNTHMEGNHYNTNDDGYYRKSNTRRRSIKSTYGAPGTHVRHSAPRNRGIIITHDANGKVRRIGNVFVNYNRIGQVKRFGSVYIRYNRRGVLTQVGGLHLKYNRRGQLIKLIGQVNFHNQGCGICGNSSCSAKHLGYSHQQDNNWDNNWNTDNNHYYYRKNGKVTTQAELKTLKKEKK